MDELTDHTVVIILQHTHTHKITVLGVYIYSVLCRLYLSKAGKNKGEASTASQNGRTGAGLAVEMNRLSLSRYL